MMDQNRSNDQDDHPLRVSYGYSAPPNDSFNSFLNNSNDPTFNPSWDPQPFNQPSEPTNSYDQSGHGWPNNTLQPSTLPHVPNYNIHNGIYDQPYSRSPVPFDYSSFAQNRGTGNSAPPYDHSFTYGHPSLPNHDQYGFPRAFQQSQQQPQTQTISPQALQNYPAGYQQTNVQRTPMVSPLSSIRFF